MPTLRRYLRLLGYGWNCAVEYIEIEPPVFQPENMTEIETEVNVEEQKEFSSGEEAEEYFGKRPDRSLRRSDR